MHNSQEYISILKANLPQIQAEFGVTGLALFGSIARGDNRPDSDVDLLIDMPPKILLVSQLKDFLERILNTSVDLVRKHSHLSPKFLQQISHDAITIL